MPPLSKELQIVIEQDAERYGSAHCDEISQIKGVYNTGGELERGYIAGATAYAHYKEEAERYRKALERIKDNILLQGPKEVAIDNRLHMIIYSSLHTAQAALNPPAGDNTKTEKDGE